MRQIGANEICPCGSGLKHIECCMDRYGFKWVKNDKGEVNKSLSLDKKSAEFMKQQFKIAKQKEEDGTNPKGLLFPDMDLEKIFKYSLSIMIHPDIHEKAMGYRKEYDALQIYSFLVEDLMVTEENIKKLDTTDRVLILNAMIRFFYEPNKEALLKPYKEKMGDTLYKIVLRIFKTEPVTREHLKEYIHLIGDESVVKMAEKQRKQNRNSLCLCGSGKKYKKCCGK